jgi:hypothetical protein
MTNSITIQELQINKADLSKCHWASRSVDALQSGQVLLKIHHFAFTSNNVTYGVTGESFSYWEFFPAEEGHGIIPVWGFATAEQSEHPEVAVGTRLYGYYPMADRLVIEPVKVTPTNIVDGIAHRAKLPMIYNSYIPSDTDPMYTADSEPMQMLFRPLFATAYLVGDMMESQKLFGAESVIFTSASSKTAYSSAAVLKQLNCVPGEIIGLTSASNKVFTESTGLYDRVVAYEDITSLAAGPACIVDMAGNGDVLGDIYRHFGSHIKHNAAIGKTHWKTGGVPKGLDGARPTVFFAPAWYEKRMAQIGGKALNQGLGMAWAQFAKHAASLVNVKTGSGTGAISGCYLTMLSGKVDPADGHILSLN